MALVGKTVEEKIYNFLKAAGFTDAGAAGLMGNLYAESGLIPTNLQNSYEKTLHMTDLEYTAAVDNGSYTNFVHDSAGYGLWQLTYWSRKEGFLKYAKSKHKSIGDLETQLEYLMIELKQYGLLNILKNCESVVEASNLILLQFEKPASMNEKATQNKRANYGQGYYDKFAKSQKEKEEFTLADFTTLFYEMRKELQDNDSNDYSLEARKWAVEKGLIAGNGTIVNGEPNYMWGDILTREQFVTVMYRFAQML